MTDQNDRAAALRALILARIDTIGQAEVARRVAPLWGWAPRDAETRLSRWRRGTKDMGANSIIALLSVLDLVLVEQSTGDDKKTLDCASARVKVVS